MNTKPEKKYALVTRGNKGIGFAISKGLLESNHFQYYCPKQKLEPRFLKETGVLTSQLSYPLQYCNRFQ